MPVDYNPEDRYWMAEDTYSQAELDAWAKLISEAPVVGDAVHKHGPFTHAQVNRARITKQKIQCPSCGQEVRVL